ncbi:hypothetical protein ACFLZH_03750 [Patescibacteria group bacterium]
MDKPNNTYGFGTDFHGNSRNIDAFLHEAKEREVGHVIFGGDITPKQMAVKFTDGGAVRLPLPVKTVGYEKIPIIQPVSAKDSQESGFMLVDSEFNTQEVEMWASIIDKIANFRRIQHCEFSLEEIELLKRTKQSFFKALEIVGFNVLKRQLGSFINEEITPELIFELFILNLKLDYAFYFKPGDMKEILTGDPNTDRRTLDQAMSRASVITNSGSLQHMLSMYSKYLNPFIQWDETHRNLNNIAPEKHKEFLAQLFEKIRALKQTFSGSVSLILGNDDTFELQDDLDETEREGLIVNATNQVKQLSPDVQVLGYSHLPDQNLADYGMWYKTEAEILNDLTELSKKIKAGVEFTIGNIHVSPSGTALSQAMIPNKDTQEFGSPSVRQFLETSPLHIAFTGHTHESWQITDQIRDLVGQTHVFNPGASMERPRFLFGNLENPDEFEIVD